MRRLSVCIAVVLAAGACGGEPRITADGLGRVMPASGDAPAGTSYLPEQSGPRTLDQFVSEEEVRTKLTSLGFRAARTATFTTPNLPPDLSQSLPGARLYAAFGIQLVNPDYASQAFDYYAERLRTRAKNYTPLLTERVGAESVAFRFSQLQETPLPGIAYVWRFGNALFGVVGVGNPDTDATAVRALVDEMETQSSAEA